MLTTGTGLRTVLQPIVDLRVAEIAGYEALTRFDGASAPPHQWFVVAHASGQGAVLEALALRSAFSRRAVVPAGVFLAGNVSPHLLDTAPLLRALLGLRARGARIALDDMGTGYSGLRELATLQPDVVKLDRSFTDHCDSDTVKAAVVAAVRRPARPRVAARPAGRRPPAAGPRNRSQAAVPRGARDAGQPRHRRRHHGLGTGCRRRGDVRAHHAMVPGAGQCRGRPGARRTGRSAPPAGPGALGERGPAGDEFPITLRTSLDTPLTHLARQISARPATQRIDPVVCTGTDGTYLGVVDVDQLLRVLADQVANLGRVRVPTT